MSKPIIPPAKPSGAPGESEETLREIGRVLGAIPNIYRTAAHSPAALQSLWFQVGAASHMSLTARLREIIALRVAQFNGCSYSLAAHTSMAVEFGIDSEQAL
ncbi:MAG: carboxymuconolactone decarboxylase family protein, partial [Planctomycetota bacterium]|nr:carboxymuconolactone decarboxylase family protein [Planctomycetota bacterium]